MVHSSSKKGDGGQKERETEKEGGREKKTVRDGRRKEGREGKKEGKNIFEVF